MSTWVPERGKGQKNIRRNKGWKLRIFDENYVTTELRSLMDSTEENIKLYQNAS